MKTYRSEIGYGILAFLSIVFGSILGSMFFKREPLEAILSTAAVFLAVYVLFLYLNFSTRYIIAENGFLKIKCGIVYSKSIEISKIQLIAKTSNPISSPAPSLDRIRLDYDQNHTIIISPKDKWGFARELTKINPAIQNRLIK